MRAYGTDCVYEYTCEQCRLARPDAGAEPCLRRTRQGLEEQLAEATERGWIGEIERLTRIASAVDVKLAEIDRARRCTELVLLPMPTVRRREGSKG